MSTVPPVVQNHMPINTSHRRAENRIMGKFALTVGIALVAMALFCNQWLLAYLLSPDAAIDDPADLLVIWCVQGVFFVWGGLNLVFSRRAIVAKINLLLISLFLVSPLVAECVIRGAIVMGVKAFRDPGLYTDALSDDDYWKLQYLWSDGQGNPRLVPDQLLGWVPRSSPENPLGVIAHQPYTVDVQRAAILFYGDSFVDSPVPSPDTIPELLSPLVPNLPVYNYGVQGYGVDQIFLRFQQSHSRFQRPFILFGIMTSDLDRCVLQFRGAPKPFFVVCDDHLELAGTPVNASRDEWIADHGVRIRSYLCSFAVMRYRLHLPGNLREASGRLNEKKQVNARLLREVVGYCREHNVPLKFVLFYDPEELTEYGWREKFLREQLQDLRADFIDTKPVLLEHARQDAVDVASYYRSDHHLNERGNQIVARAIADSIGDWIEK